MRVLRAASSAGPSARLAAGPVPRAVRPANAAARERAVATTATSQKARAFDLDEAPGSDERLIPWTAIFVPRKVTLRPSKLRAGARPVPSGAPAWTPLRRRYRK